MTYLHIPKAQVPAHLRIGYAGNKFTVSVVESVSIPSDAGLWSGGSRDAYHWLELSSGRTFEAVNHAAPPWDIGRDGRAIGPIALQPGYGLRRHTVFGGHDMGLRFFIHPANATAFLPAPVETGLSEDAKHLLAIIASIKSSYRAEYAARRDIIGLRYENAFSELALAGLINARGAITIKGKNVESTLPKTFKP